MPLQYDFNARQLGSLGLSPQISNMGSIEFHIDRMPGLAGGKQALLLGLSEIDLPSPRKATSGEIDYLFGSVHYPQKIDGVGTMKCTFQDYINGRQRDILHLWFDLIFDERTGLGAPIHLLKADADVILFDRSGEKRMEYQLHGVYPTSDPEFPTVKYGAGDFVTIGMDFSVDWFEEVFAKRETQVQVSIQ